MIRATRMGAWVILSFLLSSAIISATAQPAPHAIFRGGDSLQRSGNVVFGWHNTATNSTAGRHLTRGEGRPLAWQVIDGSITNLVLRLDGSSALWSPHNVLGTLTNEFTVVAYLRLRGTNGFLFDGSSNVGMTRAQIRDGRWQMGVQPRGIQNVTQPDSPTHPAKLGEWQAHAFVFKSAGTGTEGRHYIDGQKPVSVSSPTPPRLTGLVLGANAKVENSLATDIAEFVIYPVALNDEQIADVTSTLTVRWGQIEDSPEQDLTPTELKDPQVFRTVLRKRGDDGVACYRIPGLATTTNGTLLAVFDIRHKSCGDLPADIDVGLMRSTDDGATWSAMQHIMDFDAAEPNTKGNGVGDPCILVDQKTGTIFVAGLWSHGDRGWSGSGPGMSPAETGQFLLTRSDDDGLTWSAPINITSQIKKSEWRLVLQGPGAGIQLRDGTLVFPTQHRDANGQAHAFFIFSKDGGKTWTSSAAIEGPGVPETTEAQVAELSDGNILITLRNHAGKGLRAWSRWEWSNNLAQGAWTPLTYENEDPVCQASLIRANDDILIFANPASSITRSAMSLRFSRDDGRSWSAPRLLDPRPSAYSSMSILRDGSIGILYECGDAFAADTLTFARVPLEWVLSAKKGTGPLEK
jgi:sialidase-1